MAAPRKASKPATRTPATERQRLQISPSVEIAKRFRLAAVALDLSETELFERLIELNFPSLHVQNLSKSPFFGAGQGGNDDPSSPVVSVPIPRGPAAVLNRIGDMARKTALPVDMGIESHVQETDQP